MHDVTSLLKRDRERGWLLPSVARRNTHTHAHSCNWLFYSDSVRVVVAEVLHRDGTRQCRVLRVGRKTIKNCKGSCFPKIILPYFRLVCLFLLLFFYYKQLFYDATTFQNRTVHAFRILKIVIIMFVVVLKPIMSMKTVFRKFETKY